VYRRVEQEVAELEAPPGKPDAAAANESAAAVNSSATLDRASSLGQELKAGPVTEQELQRRQTLCDLQDDIEEVRVRAFVAFIRVSACLIRSFKHARTVYKCSQHSAGLPNNLPTTNLHADGALLAVFTHTHAALQKINMVLSHHPQNAPCLLCVCHVSVCVCAALQMVLLCMEMVLSHHPQNLYLPYVNVCCAADGAALQGDAEDRSAHPTAPRTAMLNRHHHQVSA
jgi:hypothetical protein